jgi:hypothetical protein
VEWRRLQDRDQHGGAVSAGAYTAGVLDFLIEALEEWENAKLAFRDHLANPYPAGPFRHQCRCTTSPLKPFQARLREGCAPP